MEISTRSPEQKQPEFSFKKYINNGFQDYYEHVKLFTKNARLYLLASFLIGINFHVFQLLLNLYLRELGFEETQIGWVLSARAVGMTVIAIPAALLLSRVKLKPILLLSCILYAVFSYFIISNASIYVLIGFSLLAGMSFAFYRVAANPFYMRNSSIKERTHLFSVSFAMMIMAGMAGSIGSGWLVTKLGDATGDIILGYQYTLMIGIAVSLLALIPFFMIKASDPSAEENRIRLDRKQFRERGRFYWKIFSVNFLVGMGAGLVIPFLNLYFRDRFNLEPDTIGLFYFFVAFAMLSGSLIGPVITKRLGLVRAVVVTQLLSIPFLLILAFSYYLPLVFAAFLLRAGLMNLGVPIVNNLGMELSDKNEQGLVNALLTVAWTSSWMISTAVGGTMIDLYGYTITMNTTIILYLFSTGIFYFFFRKVEIKTDASPRWVIAKENNT